MKSQAILCVNKFIQQCLISSTLGNHSSVTIQMVFRGTLKVYDFIRAHLMRNDK